ncbi:hypothetical protein OS31_29850 [Dickeya oryzae]
MFLSLPESLRSFFDQPTQGFQDRFEKAYYSYKDSYDKVYANAVEENNASYSTALWLLVSVAIFVVVMALIVWLGINRSLVQPLHNLIEHIRHMAKGDLTTRIDFHGTNEMGILADSLRHMQTEFFYDGECGSAKCRSHLHRSVGNQRG